jgi:SAM-dependent methyltransferase
MSPSVIDPIWEEEIYSRGRHLNRYPYDSVVSFVHRWRPRDRAPAATRLLEVGCGAGNNLWFAAREGFRVAGIDGSASAVAWVRTRFAEEGLEADLHTGCFTELPWADGLFDLVIDRCSLTCAGRPAQQEAVDEIQRVLRPGGVLFSNGYSDRHTSATSGTPQPDGRVADIRAGTLAGVGALYFSTREDITARFARGWQIESLEHTATETLTGGTPGWHTEWRVVARKS